MSDERLTHEDEAGRLRMVDVGHKPPMHRRAVARGRVFAPAFALDRLESGDLPKGEGLAAARIAGVLAAKRCDELIPLCHTLPLDAVQVDFRRAEPGVLEIEATATITARTGVEMEALTAVSMSALTIWDMLKGITADLRIGEVVLVEKTKRAVDGADDRGA